MYVFSYLILIMLCTLAEEGEVEQVAKVGGKQLQIELSDVSVWATKLFVLLPSHSLNSERQRARELPLGYVGAFKPSSL